VDGRLNQVKGREEETLWSVRAVAPPLLTTSYYMMNHRDSAEVKKQLSDVLSHSFHGVQQKQDHFFGFTVFHI
jgi:hypothetical protein